jgi:alkanesulfonate monooxygenase SsuD/methylene tetrahydromethanopterin reductase-like flavin-dependent oxidoreductase (luciferase family)
MDQRVVPMRIGVSPFATTRAGVEALAAVAVAGGLDPLWLGDGLLHNPDFPTWSGAMEACTELAWLAGRFPTAAVALGAAVLPLRDTTWLAKQAMTLDHVTGGRFTLAVAPGFWPAESAARGVDYAKRGAHLADAVAGLQAAFRGEGYEGTFVRVPAGLSPGVFTAGGPPLWLAGAEATMRRALALGLPFQASRMSPDALAPWATAWQDGGGGLLAVRIRVGVGPVSSRSDGVDWQALTGPPADLTEQLARYAALGVSDVSLLPGQDDRSSNETVEALVGEVLPALADAGLLVRA